MDDSSGDSVTDAIDDPADQPVTHRADQQAVDAQDTENAPAGDGPVTVGAPIPAEESGGMPPHNAPATPAPAEDLPEVDPTSTPDREAAPVEGYQPFLSMTDKAWPAQKWEPRAAFGAALVSAAILAVASSSSWAHGSGRRPAGGSYVALHVSVAGHTISPLITAISILAVAGAAAIPATRGRGRAVIGVLLAIGGLIVDVQAADRRRAAVTRVYHLLGANTSAHATGTKMWGIALLGGNLLFLTGLLMVIRGQMWAALSSRYERPSADSTPATTAVRGDAGTWDALDRGEDPTSAANVASKDEHPDGEGPDDPVPAGV